jgi:hypothetical protein
VSHDADAARFVAALMRRCTRLKTLAFMGASDSVEVFCLATQNEPGRRDKARSPFNDKLEYRSLGRREQAIAGHLFRGVAKIVYLPGCELSVLLGTDARRRQRLRGESNLSGG